MKPYAFANAIMDHFDEQTGSMQVYLSDQFIETIFSNRLLPMRVITDNRTIGFNQLIEIFGEVPYIATNRKAARTFMVMNIICKEKEYNDHKYYEHNLKALPNNGPLYEKLVELRRKVNDRRKELTTAQELYEGFDEL